jgi:hypothetical protein
MVENLNVEEIQTNSVKNVLDLKFDEAAVSIGD